MPGGYGAIDHGKGHRTKAERATWKVPAPGPVTPPDLPEGTAFAVLYWYETWKRAPQAVLFSETDWQRLVMLAPLVEAYYANPDRFTMAEIRQNESLLGATVVDRLRGKIEYVEEAASHPPVVDDEVAAKRTLRDRLA